MNTAIKNLCLLALLQLPFAGMAEKHYYELNVGDFNKLKIQDNANVIYRCNPDSAGYAAFHAEPEFADAFIFSNNNKGTLKIQVNTDDLGQPGLPTLLVYSNFLSEIENSSEFTTMVETIAPCAKFKAKLIGNGKLVADNLNCTDIEAVISTGNGTIVLSGTTSSLSLKMVGTGVIQADNLMAKHVNCQKLGTGSIGCWATESLNVKGIGTTKVYYKGNPSEIKKSGGGQLIKLDDNDIDTDEDGEDVPIEIEERQ